MEPKKNEKGKSLKKKRKRKKKRKFLLFSLRHRWLLNERKKKKKGAPRTRRINGKARRHTTNTVLRGRVGGRPKSRRKKIMSSQ